VIGRLASGNATLVGDDRDEVAALRPSLSRTAGRPREAILFRDDRHPVREPARLPDGLNGLVGLEHIASHGDLPLYSGLSRSSQSSGIRGDVEPLMTSKTSTP
jgi:hypothetical protein